MLQTWDMKIRGSHVLRRATGARPVLSAASQVKSGQCGLQAASAPESTPSQSQTENPHCQSLSSFFACLFPVPLPCFCLFVGTLKPGSPTVSTSATASSITTSAEAGSLQPLTSAACPSETAVPPSVLPGHSTDGSSTAGAMEGEPSVARSAPAVSSAALHHTRLTPLGLRVSRWVRRRRRGNDYCNRPRPLRLSPHRSISVPVHLYRASTNKRSRLPAPEPLSWHFQKKHTAYSNRTKSRSSPSFRTMNTSLLKDSRCSISPGDLPNGRNKFSIGGQLSSNKLVVNEDGHIRQNNLFRGGGKGQDRSQLTVNNDTTLNQIISQFHGFPKQHRSAVHTGGRDDVGVAR
ncbi:hypothetical protein AOLI_G00282380 [Acnodon oligacanthus]